MRHLIAKDVRLVAPYVWLIVPGHVLWCAQAFLVPELYFWLSLAAALAWTVTVLLIEWHLEADRLVASLPVTRAAIVRARYASAFGALALSALLYVVYGHALMAVAGERLAGRWHGAASWSSVDGLAAFVAIGYVLIAGFLPFHFRFGLPFGASLFAVVAALVAAVATAAGAGGAVTGVPPSEAARQYLSPLLLSWERGLAALAAAAAVGALSLWLSIRFHERRDL